MKLPELILKQVIDELLDLITDNFNNSPSESDSFLYQVFYGNSMGVFDFYEQAKALFLRTSEDPRKLETRVMFDSTRADLPTIHIVLPSESTGKDNTIGVSRSDENFVRSDGVLQPLYRRSFDTNYQLAISSGNMFETIMIYQGLKTVLISAMDSLSLNGLRLPSLSGNDIELNSDQVPGLFIRALTVQVDYDMEVPSLVQYKPLGDINIKDVKIEE